MGDKKLEFLMNNILKKSNEKVVAENSVLKKYKGILPEEQLKVLSKEQHESYSNFDMNLKSSDIPHKEKDYIVRQSSVRQNLITEVDVINMKNSQDSDK